jgi:hypothetical protein
VAAKIPMLLREDGDAYQCRLGPFTPEERGKPRPIGSGNGVAFVSSPPWRRCLGCSWSPM